MEQTIGYLLKRISDRLKVNADANLKELGITLTQAQILAIVKQAGGQTTQKEVERALRVSHPTVVGVVARLEQGGFLDTWPANDNRNKMVRLTAKAEALGQRIEEGIAKQNQKLEEILSPAQLRDLEASLTAILEALGETQPLVHKKENAK